MVGNLHFHQQETMSDTKISATPLFNVNTTSLTKAQKRWRLAFWTIYFARAKLSLISKTQNHSLQKQTYVALDIGPSSSSHHSNNIDSNVDASTLKEMVKNKNLLSYRRLGGVEGVAAALGTDLKNGISGNIKDISRRSQIYGTNTYHRQPRKGFFHFVMEGFKDTNILISLPCAALALGFGIKIHGLKEGWYDGGSLFVAVILVVVVSAFCNFRQETQFGNLLINISNNIKVKVVRGAVRQQVSLSELVVGDVVVLYTGDQIPADGLFLYGYSLQVDVSSMTGESHHIKVDSRNYPFLLSGSKVAKGHAVMVVVSVGMNTARGEMMSLISRNSDERTPLQARLDKVISAIARLALAVVVIALVSQFVHYFTGKTKDKNGKKEFNGSETDLNDVLKSVGTIVLDTVTIVVAAIPVGLRLSINLTLAYSMKRMMADGVIVRKLSACETMGSATVICTDKTGTLTLNKMKVTRFWIGQDSIEEEISYNVVAPNVRELFDQAVGLNTTGSVFRSDAASVPEFSGSPTEKAILSWAVLELGMDIIKVKQEHIILEFETFNSEKKRSGISVRKIAGNTIHVHWKGAAEMILAMCSHRYESDGAIKALDEDERSNIENIINGMAASSLTCIAFAHKQIPEEEMEHSGDGETHERLKEDGLTFLGIVALKDPCRPGLKRGVGICKSAGVDIKMITGDNVVTAKAIAAACGILESDQQVECGDQVVEGIEFRNYTQDERMQKVNTIRVMARSSPDDKLLMIECLKQKGHVVAVTGRGTDNVSALKEADIGLSMGIHSSEIAKNSSDMVILNNDFTSVGTALELGRRVYNNIQKFIQFQLTVNVTALAINYVVVLISGKVPLTAVQFLWVNLIMVTLGAVALASDRPTNELMESPPQSRTDPIITNIMWRNLLSQALYQLAVLLILHFEGKSIFAVSPQVNDTMIFNTFVLCQVFNEFNARKLEKKNIFEGIHKNLLFLGILGITMALQFLMVEFLHKFGSTERLNWRQWVDCIAMAILTWPIGWVVKFIPVREKPLFVDSNGDLDFGFGKCMKFLCCCLLKSFCPDDCEL